MSDKHKDVLIAAYLFEDLAKQDFDAVLKLAEQKTITAEGVVLVQKDDDAIRDVGHRSVSVSVGPASATDVGFGNRDRLAGVQPPMPA